MHHTNVPDALGLRGLRVLVVEDAPAAVNALKNFLEDSGPVLVGTVSTPDAAERLLAEQPPDLALVDMHLGGHTGYTLVERMRQVKVPVIAISGLCRTPCRGAERRHPAKAVQRPRVANNSPSTGARHLMFS
jgi:CheY-like chemotaxis protein